MNKQIIIDYEEYVNKYEELLVKYSNLQKENDKLKKLEYKFFYCSEDEESFTLEDYLELGNKVYDLEQENAELKEINKEQANRLISKDNLSYEDYKSRNEKAIEYIKTLEEDYPDYDGEMIIGDIGSHCKTKLLNILQGGDDNGIMDKKSK